MGAMGMFIPEVVKIIINRQVRVVMDKTATVVEVTPEIAVAAVMEEEVMVMEEVAIIVAVVVDTVAATLVEDMAEVRLVINMEKKENVSFVLFLSSKTMFTLLIGQGGGGGGRYGDRGGYGDRSGGGYK